MPATTSTKKKKEKKEKLPAAAYGDSKQLRREVVKRPAMNNKEEEDKTKKKAKVKKEEGQDQDGAARVWMCKKNDGRRWHCNRPVSQPDSLCEYHLVQKRSYLNPDFEFQSVAESEKPKPKPKPALAPVQAAAASKSSTSSKPRKKKKKPVNDCSATEGFYYYAGFGPFRSKRQCRSGGMNEPLPAKQEEEEKEETPEDASDPTDEAAPEVVDEFTNQQAACQHVSSCDNDDIAGIAGVDEQSSDDDYDGIGIAGCNMDDATVDPQASSGDGKRKAPWKRWRKPVKARSLKSLM